jgi:hypothetical protein
MFPDKVEIFQPTTNKATKATTYTSLGISEAYIEDFDKVLYNSIGNEVAPDLLVGLPKTVTVDKGFGVKVIERHGVNISATEEMKQVKQLHMAGSFIGSHLEVYLA